MWPFPAKSQRAGVVNHAPYRPTLVANPAYDWYVTIGDAPQLCAQAQGDPDGDPVTQYRFVASASVGTVDSGWISSSCHSFGSITPGTYEWHAQVMDSLGGISDWSDNWHFTAEPTGVTAYIDHFTPASPSNADEVKIYGCSSGHAGVNITLRVLVNDANDGSDSGEWHIIKEQGSPCFNDIDVPIWRTLEYADGPHLVRVVAMAIQPDAGDVYDEVYTLNHRRPDSTRLVAPVPLSQDYREAVYLNSRTVTFQWEPTIRADSYTLHIGANPSPKDDASPIFRQTFASGVTEHTVTFDQDYSILYWQVEATNDVGSNASVDQLFGIDREDPSCTVEPLSAITYESVFQVSWHGSDNLAGVRSFDIQYLDTDRTEWSDWLTSVPVTTTTDLFTGQPGHSYAFRCRATDNANNTGDYPDSADTSTMIDPTARPTTPWWDSAYSEKRNLVILNNMPGVVLPMGYPIHLHFDDTTSPTAAELYSASQSTPKCNDLRVIYDDTTELDRVVQDCSSSVIDIWFRTQISIPGGSSDSTAHQLYYGNGLAGAPPADPNQVWYPNYEADTTYLYFLQEGSGATAYDSSGNGRNCSVDASVQWALSKFGDGLRFNRANSGDSRSLNCGSAIPLSSFTIEFWYKPDADDGGRIAGELAGGGNGGGGNNWLLQNSGGRIRLDVWPCPTCGSSEVQSDFDLGDAQYVGKWNHIAVTFNGANEVRFYINGALDSTKYLSQSGINTFTPPLEIGSSEGVGQIKANLGTFRISSGVKTSFSYGAFAAITGEPTTAAGALIEPPVSGSPDLAVLSLTTYPNPSGGVLVQAVFQNQGDLSTENGFYTDLYVDHLPTGSGDYTDSIQFWVNDPITPGATITLTTVMTDLSGAGGVNVLSPSAANDVKGTLYAQVDSMGSVGEPDEANNIYSAGTEICVTSPDAFESNDTFDIAPLITLYETQSHNLDRPGDQDWVRFDAGTGITYTISTQGLGPSSDTYLYLYDSDGTTLLAANDDYGAGLASRLDWTAPVTGTYYLLVKHWNPNVGGCGTSYSLSLGEKQNVTNLRYVALGGVDAANDCTDSVTPCATAQHAVDVADPGDEIRVAAGTYTGVSAREGVTQAVYISKTVTVRGGYATVFTDPPDPDADPTTLDAQGQGRVLYITGDITPTVEGLRITGGDAAGLGGNPRGGDAGGGVYVIDATVTLSGNAIYGNTAGGGGGICLVLSDSATLSGNAIYDNTALPWRGGGGVYLHESNGATLSGNDIYNNTTDQHGGGIYLDLSDSATLSGNAIYGNTAGGGGAVGLYGTVDATLSGNYIYSNTANIFGSGVELSWSDDATLDNNVIADNQECLGGSGVYVGASNARLRHNTLARNPGTRAGIYITNWGINYSAVALTNTILVSQTVGINVTAGNTVKLEGTLWGSGAWANTTDWTSGGTLITGTVNLWSDPDFVNPAGGDYHIGSTSAARDAGIGAGVTDDIDGDPRKDGYPDIGADEYPGASLEVIKQPSAVIVNRGVLTYTIAVASAGMEDATGVVLTDTLDGWQRPITATSSVGGCSVTDEGWDGTVVCMPGTLVPGTTAWVTLTAQISTTIPMGQVITNTVVVTANETMDSVQVANTVHDCHVRINDDPTKYTSVQAAVDAANPGDLVKVAGYCLGVNERGGCANRSTWTRA